MPKHLAFAILPAHGHVNPTLPLVEELVRRGHRVSYLTGEECAAKIERTGAEVKLVSGGMPTGPPPTKEFGIEMIRMMLDRFLDGAEETVPETLRHLEGDRPDAVFYDMLTWSARAAAEKLDIPAIQLAPSFASNEHYSMISEFFPGFDPDAPELAEVGERYAEFSAKHGIPVSIRNVFDPTPRGLNLVFLPKQFQLASETFDDRFVFLGPSLGLREVSDEWQPPASGAPVLFISLGTGPLNDQPDFFRMCTEAFGDSPWHVAMATGDRIDPASLGEIPANFDVRQYFPQPTVLRHATAFVSHAGMNSTMESLYFEVPLITVPQMPEQEANAARIEELALGQRLRESTAENLRELADRVSADTGIRENLAGIGSLIRGGGGAELGADSIEKYLAGLGA